MKKNYRKLTAIDQHTNKRQRKCKTLGTEKNLSDSSAEIKSKADKKFSQNSCWRLKQKRYKKRKFEAGVNKTKQKQNSGEECNERINRSWMVAMTIDEIFWIFRVLIFCVFFANNTQKRHFYSLHCQGPTVILPATPYRQFSNRTATIAQRCTSTSRLSPVQTPQIIRKSPRDF